MNSHNKNLALSQSNLVFKVPEGANLLERTVHFYEWQQLRNQHGYWPFSRSLESAPTSSASIRDARGNLQQGVNFASQDYLSLASHPMVKEAAIAAIRDFGVHSAGSSAVLGNTRLSLQLEAALAEFLQSEHVVLFPTGWAAGYGVSRGLVRRDDYIVMDALSHSCLQEGAYASTSKISQFKHLDFAHAEFLLKKIRQHDQVGGILVITEGLFSMDSDSPDIFRFQEVCDEYQATLLVDVAHDLGALGPHGRGQLELQNMLGKVELVMGSFSKSFASNGGFVATRNPAARQYLSVFSPSTTFSNALSPIQAAIVLKTIEIIRSDEGEQLRRKLMDNILALRSELERNGLTVMGEPSPIVPVLIGREDHARVASSLLPEYGVLANMVEYAAVPPNMARFRMQVMASHTIEECRIAAAGVAKAIHVAKSELP